MPVTVRPDADSQRSAVTAKPGYKAAEDGVRTAEREEARILCSEGHYPDGASPKLLEPWWGRRRRARLVVSLEPIPALVSAALPPLMIIRRPHPTAQAQDQDRKPSGVTVAPSAEFVASRPPRLIQRVSCGPFNGRLQPRALLSTAPVATRDRCTAADRRPAVAPPGRPTRPSPRAVGCGGRHRALPPNRPANAGPESLGSSSAGAIDAVGWVALSAVLVISGGSGARRLPPAVTVLLFGCYLLVMILVVRPGLRRWFTPVPRVEGPGTQLLWWRSRWLPRRLPRP